VFGSSARCPGCDAKVAPHLTFCPKCGTGLTPTAPPQGILPPTPPGEEPGPAALFDRQDQFEKIKAQLVTGEVIDAVFDMKGGGTGFVGITNRRVIVYDKAFLRKHKAIVTIPYSKINSVAAKDASGLFTGRGYWASSELILTTSAGDFEFEFRGAEKAHQAHSLIVEHLT
jgi:hypothetical protein